MLPASWTGFTATRRFWGATYDIRATNGSPGSRVRDLVVDGQPCTGTLLPPAPPGSTVVVEAITVAE